MTDILLRPGTDAAALLAEALVLAASGNGAQALSACEQALAAWPDITEPLRLQLRLAHALGDRERMVSALEQLLRFAPDDAEHVAMLAGLLCDAGDFARVAELLRPVVGRLGERGNAVWNYATALAVTGAHEELRAARPLLDRLAATAPVPFAPYQHLAGARLAGVVERDRVLSDLAALERSPRWLDAAGCLAALSDAISNRRPYSVVRLDVASARFGALCGRNAGRLLRPEERLATLDSVWRPWFGTSSRDVDDAVLAGLGRDLLGAIGTADVVAMPDADDLQREHQHFGFLAEQLHLVRIGTDARFAGTHVATAMHQLVPYLRTALLGVPFLGLVGPYPSMLRKLAHFCGVAETGCVPLPREATLPVLEDGVEPSGFMPDGHEAALDAIRVTHPGAVFLVSAPGPLGPIYAARIKALDGIAIDIGPLAGRWSGNER